MKRNELKKWLKEAKKLIKESKEFDKIIYQLAFIATGYGPNKIQAIKKLRELVKMGIMTEHQYKKIIQDVKRWREYYLKDKALSNYRKYNSDDEEDYIYNIKEEVMENEY